MATIALAVVQLSALSLFAQTTPPVNDATGLGPDGMPVKEGEGLGGALRVRKNARTTTQSIPAPRGQVTDRHGVPFAQNKVVWYPAIRFGQFEKDDKETVIAWGRKRVDFINRTFGIEWGVKDEELWAHYRYRRWFALPVTHVVEGERKKTIASKLLPGVILHPVYMRHYPQGKCAAHIIGYVGSAGKLEKGPINYGDPMFERTEGRSGLEKIFDKTLTGREGLLRQDYQADGTQVLKKYERRPRPGGTVITTLDMKWQKHAETVLKRHCARGAFVVIDIHTGEVIAMASRPGFNLNDFIPFISTEKYAALRDDPATPLFARAYQGGYPPASAFKPIVAVTALSNGEISERTLVNCPGKIKIGQHWFHNWSRKSEGDLSVKRAIARSNNPWFYQVGMRTGPTAFLSVARRLGMGSKTGLPLIGETSGLIPSHEWMKKHHGRRMTDGDTANLAIGQGVMLASPLQVAQAMAGLANGGALPKLHLVKQVQDVSGKVMLANTPKRRNWLHLNPDLVPIVHEGMMDVVHAGYGTGKRGKLSFTVLCGKTGTAQWGPKSLDQRLAWFAGFFPLENPRYAFAALYEGKPHEKLSGGKKAAPMVRAFFEHFKKDIRKTITPPPKAMVIEEDEEDDDVRRMDTEEGDEGVPRAIPVEEEEDGLIPSDDDVRPLRAIPVEEDEEDEGEEEDEAPPLRPLRRFNNQ